CGAVHRQTPEAGARCVNRARRDLCGGYPVTGIPTATSRMSKGSKEKLSIVISLYVNEIDEY
ncbi:hypothetical protein ACYCAT_28285, partial [Klebsiella pneumoniae]